MEILPGNVGYLGVSSFFGPVEAGDAIADAMHMLRNADALIVDMRDNSGGSPDTVALVASYFFDTPGVPLLDIVQRSGELHYATQAGISDRNGTRPMYVLTSAQTWSGGEGLPFVLQERHRAEIIGETTSRGSERGPCVLDLRQFLRVCAIWAYAQRVERQELGRRRREARRGRPCCGRASRGADSRAAVVAAGGGAPRAVARAASD